MVYEYVIGIDPRSDASANAGTESAGLLMAGTLTFNSAGQIIGMTGFKPGSADPANLSAWQTAPLVNGLPALEVNFSGSGAQSISLDLGLHIPAGSWNAGISTPADGATNPEAFFAATVGATRARASTTAFDGSSANVLQKQDGYPEGVLNDLYINAEGVITARYNNGQSLELYQISLFRFKSEDGLRHEGNNHFSATAESGAADEGLPTVENFGAIISNNLELSNVDIAREFTHMIIHQRGFQSNSKVITTADQMLQKALELKR